MGERRAVDWDRIPEDIRRDIKPRKDSEAEGTAGAKRKRAAVKGRTTSAAGVPVSSSN